MNSKLTISIVTKDRIKEFTKCIRRLSRVNDIDSVKVDIWDNSSKWVYYIKRCIAFILGRNLNYRMTHHRNFTGCRNYSVLTCNTEFITILDDDDYLHKNAIRLILKNIEKYPNTDMFSYNVAKCNYEDSDHPMYDFTNNEYRVIDKEFSLNSFDNYAVDKHTKVYLWNCAHVMRVSTLTSYGIGWGPIGCDDVLPITSLYLVGNVHKFNDVIYFYEQQSTVCSDKSLVDLMHLDHHLHVSYTKLFLKYGEIDCGRRVLLKALHNSIRQLQHIDKYESSNLNALYKVYSIK